jgi:hypothetical protein
MWRPYTYGILISWENNSSFLPTSVAWSISWTACGYAWTAEVGSQASGYDYEILYRLSCENSTTDALSRTSDSPVLHHLHMPTVTIWYEIQKAYVRDSYVQSLTRLAKDQQVRSYAWCNGLLFFKGRVVIPSQAALLAQLHHEMYDTKIGGHFAILRTFKKLAQQFYWPKMYQVV